MGLFSVFRRKPAPPRDTLPAPRLGSPAQSWLSRSNKALDSLGQLADTLDAGPAADQLQDIRARADAAFEQLRVLAGQVTLVEDAIARIPSPALAERRARIVAGLAETSEETLHATQERTVHDIDEQLATDARLRQTKAAQLSRMEAAALGLEGLVARASEAAALAQTQVGEGPSEQIGQLAGELDGLREGLLETERISRQALGR